MSRSLDVLTDACERLPVKVRKMFGGHGFFAPNGGMFAGIVTDDAIILKLERGAARDELMAIGGKPWIYGGQRKPVTMQEWIVIPDELYDDQELLATWARRAHKLAPAKPAKSAKNKLLAKKKKKKKTTTR